MPEVSAVSAWLMAQSPLAVALGIGIWVLWKDIKEEKAAARAEDAERMKFFTDSLKELNQTHASTMDKVLTESATERRFCEERYKMVLEETLLTKKIKGQDI